MAFPGLQAAHPQHADPRCQEVRLKARGLGRREIFHFPSWALSILEFPLFTCKGFPIYEVPMLASCQPPAFRVHLRPDSGSLFFFLNLNSILFVSGMHQVSQGTARTGGLHSLQRSGS